MYKHLRIFSIGLLVLFLFSISSAYSHDRCSKSECGACKVNLKEHAKDIKAYKHFLKNYNKLKQLHYLKISKENQQLRCISSPMIYNIPDGWILTNINIDVERLYTRIFTFKDITNDCRFFVKNNQSYKAWCLDQNLIGTPNHNYMVKLFNMLQILPDYGFFETPKGKLDLFDFLFTDYKGDLIPYDKILYIINNREGYSKAEVQEAIWYYTMGEGYFDPETTGYKELVEAAEMYGDHYIPPCEGKLFVFAITRAAENTPELPACDLGQPFIIELPIPTWMCRFGFLERFLTEFYNNYLIEH